MNSLAKKKKNFFFCAILILIKKINGCFANVYPFISPLLLTVSARINDFGYMEFCEIKIKTFHFKNLYSLNFSNFEIIEKSTNL